MHRLAFFQILWPFPLDSTVKKNGCLGFWCQVYSGNQFYPVHVSVHQPSLGSGQGTATRKCVVEREVTSQCCDKQWLRFRSVARYTTKYAAATTTRYEAASVTRYEAASVTRYEAASVTRYEAASITRYATGTRYIFSPHHG